MKLKLLLSVLAFSGAVSQLSAQTDVTAPGDAVIGGQLVGGVFNVGTVGFTAGANNWPGGEAPPFSIDNNTGTKYLNFAETNTGFVVTPSSGPLSILTSIRLATANDAPERDPLDYLLEGTTGDPLTGSYTTISSGLTGLGVDPGRFTFGAPQGFANTAAFSSYRVTFPTVRNSAAANSMQVGEVELIGTVIPEPSTLCWGLATAGVVAFRRRRS